MSITTDIWIGALLAIASPRVVRCGFHRERLEPTLAMARADTYPAVAATLARIRQLMASAGEELEFAAYVASIRVRFARRPALMAALDRRGLV